MGQGGLRSAGLLAALALLAGCGGGATPGPDYPVQGQAPSAPAYEPQAPADQCGAAALQGLVGQPRTAIPVPVEMNNRRVACTACAITEDLRPERLTILYDRDSGRVERVYCG